MQRPKQPNIYDVDDPSKTPPCKETGGDTIDRQLIQAPRHTETTLAEPEAYNPKVVWMKYPRCRAYNRLRGSTNCRSIYSMLHLGKTTPCTGV